MNPSRFLFLIISILFSLNTWTALAQNAPLNDNPLATRLDSAVHRAVLSYLTDSTANGMVIGVFDDGKKVQYRYGENVRGSGKLTPSGLFYNIGSVAKTFVATLLAQAIVEKKAFLDDDVRKYLPGSFPNLEFANRAIRLVDLANHTSGLPGSFHQYPQSAMNELKGKNLTQQADFFASYNADSLLTDLHQIRPDTLPGTKFRYNSSAYMLLTYVLERIYSRPYQSLVTDYLQKHLHMNNTMPLLSGARLKSTAQGYDRNNQPVTFINLKGYFIGPSINSTIGDLLQYLEAQLSEKEPAVKLSHLQTFGAKDGFGLGLSWMMNTEHAQRYFYHDGNTKVGFNTLMTLYPKEQLGFIIIVNDVNSQQRVGQMENMIREFYKR